MTDLTDLIVTAKLEKGHSDRKDATYDAMLEALIDARRGTAQRVTPNLNYGETNTDQFEARQLAIAIGIQELGLGRGLNEQARLSGRWDGKTNAELRTEAMGEGGLARVLSDRLFDMEMAHGFLVMELKAQTTRGSISE